MTLDPSRGFEAGKLPANNAACTIKSAEKGNPF
jgi:hypothetical protein